MMELFIIMIIVLFEREKMDQVQFITILAFIVAALIFLLRELREMKAIVKEIRKDLQQLNTPQAVMESKLADINQSVNHLLWQSQVPPAKEVHE